MSKKIRTLSAGNLVKLNENGAAKKFIYLGYNHYAKSEVVLLRKDTFAARSFNPGYGSTGSGSGGYNGASIDTFCNEQYVMSLDPAIRACLINVPLPTVVGSIDSKTRNENVIILMRKCFLLSQTETGDTSAEYTEGTAFSYLSKSAANRIAYYDETDTAVPWWLRTTRYYSAYGVSKSGEFSGGGYANMTVSCPRPALALSSDILVSSSTDSDGCYTVEDVAVAGELYQKLNGVWRRMC